MKNRIEVTHVKDNLLFFLKNKKGSFYLCTTGYSYAVYDYFSSGRSENEVRSFKYWGANRRLRKVMDRLPKAIDYVMKYEVEDDE